MNEKVTKEDFIKALKSNAEINDDVISKINGGEHHDYDMRPYGKPCPIINCKSNETLLGTIFYEDGHVDKLAMCRKCFYTWHVYDD